MKNLDLERRAIDAGNAWLGREIVINTEADFTPVGKRTTRIVRYALNGRRATPHIRWYVGGKAYRSLHLTAKNVRMTEDWQLCCKPVPMAKT